MTHDPAPDRSAIAPAPGTARDGALDAALDAALARSLPPPALPPGFGTRLRAAVRGDATGALQARREALRALHAQELRELQRGQVRMQRQTLALVATLCFAAGALVSAALPWLQAALGLEASLLMPFLAAGVGAAVGLGTWLARTGQWRGRLPGW